VVFTRSAGSVFRIARRKKGVLLLFLKFLDKKPELWHSKLSLDERRPRRAPMESGRFRLGLREKKG
jgi:hypothetical protein